jgi:hypothetical protein
MLQLGIAWTGVPMRKRFGLAGLLHCRVTLWCCDSWPDVLLRSGETMAQPTRDIHFPAQGPRIYISQLPRLHGI